MMPLDPTTLATPVSDLRQSRRLEEVNRPRRISLGAAPSGLRLRTVPTDRGVDLPALVAGCRTAPQLHPVLPWIPSIPAPKSAPQRSSAACPHRSGRCGSHSSPSDTPPPATPHPSEVSSSAYAHD